VGIPAGDCAGRRVSFGWASDKNMVAQDGQLHTNFKLSASGENITLKSLTERLLIQLILSALGMTRAMEEKVTVRQSLLFS